MLEQENYLAAKEIKTQQQTLEKKFWEGIEKLKQHGNMSQQDPKKVSMNRFSVAPSSKKKKYPEDSRLYDAARSGRSQEVMKLIEEDKLNVNSIEFHSGNSALHGGERRFMLTFHSY